jgi:hypothetical protein
MCPASEAHTATATPCPCSDCQSFHIFQEASQREAYVGLLRASLAPGGLLLLLAGAPDPGEGHDTQPWLSPELADLHCPWPIQALSQGLEHGCSSAREVTDGKAKLGPPQVPRAELTAAFYSPLADSSVPLFCSSVSPSCNSSTEQPHHVCVCEQKKRQVMGLGLAARTVAQQHDGCCSTGGASTGCQQKAK